MIDFALHYARRGWPIFPLQPRGKAPLIPKREGGRGCYDATTDCAMIERWWRREPEANVGIATGRKAGIIVIDVDMKNGRDGQASIRKLVPVPTFTVRTPSRGFHLYYVMPAGGRITLGTNVLPGVDYRGDGGYVVAAGSCTAQGWYQIARALPIAPLPSNMLELLTRRAPASLTPLRPFGPHRWSKDRERVAAALAYLDPSDYETWISVGAAIHLASSATASGFDLWHAWSGGGLTGGRPANYAGVEDCRVRWQSFGSIAACRNRGATLDSPWRPVTLGTVFKLAQLRGFNTTPTQGAA